jgi:hypothetical protein
MVGRRRARRPTGRITARFRNSSVRELGRGRSDQVRAEDVRQRHHVQDLQQRSSSSRALRCVAGARVRWRAGGGRSVHRSTDLASD